MQSGALVTLDVEKPAAGGRMLARHQGRVILVAGAIPGERVVARVERASRAVVFADAIDITTASSDRRAVEGDPRCGGCAFAHIGYDRQLALKQEIVQDAFGRIGRLPLQARPAIVASPERGYRMRARLHVKQGRLGFFREGSHELCDAALTGQLAEATMQWIAQTTERLGTEQLEGLSAIEIAEDLSGERRACHLELQHTADVRSFLPLAGGLVGLSAQRVDRPEVTVIAGKPSLTDTIRLGDDAPSAAVTLQRDVRAFFQSNRFLVDRLARHVVGLAVDGPVVDLYAGVGLFGLAIGATRPVDITLVEGDPTSGGDLELNALANARARVERRSVEAFVNLARFRVVAQRATIVVDPPRTGLSRDVLAGLVGATPPRLIYVSCDPATLARDARGLLDAGYELTELMLFDMFPGTAHIETVALFVRT
jgi:23S rRNA (uracil1939-C5)-methyltransferase